MEDLFRQAHHLVEVTPVPGGFGVSKKLGDAKVKHVNGKVLEDDRMFGKKKVQT